MAYENVVRWSNIEKGNISHKRLERNMTTITEIVVERTEPRTPRELPAVVCGVMVLSEQELDLISVIEFLKEKRFINANAYRFLLRKVPTLSGSSKERMLKFALEVLRIPGMSVQQFAKCLFTYDFRFAHCAMQMLFPGSGIFLEIGRHRLPNENIRIRLFITLKTHLDSNVISAKAALLTFKAEIERNKIFNSTGVQQQLALDRYVIFTCLRIQQYANDGDKLRLLDQMKAAIPGDADRTFASALYHCKMARVTRDHLHIQQALALSQNCNDPFLWKLVALDIMHVLRENFAEDHNQSHIDEIINQCAFGLGCADDTDVFLARIIYLNLVLTFLGINDRLRVDGNAYVSHDNRTCARLLLAQIKEHLFTAIEPRRNMMYCLAKARAIDNDDIDLARAFVEDAKRLAGENTFFDTEKRNINKYLNYLNTRVPEEAFNLPQPALIEN